MGGPRYFMLHPSGCTGTCNASGSRGGEYVISTRYNLYAIHCYVPPSTLKLPTTQNNMMQLTLPRWLCGLHCDRLSALPPPQWPPQWCSISAIAGHRSRKRWSTECQHQRVSCSVSIDFVDGQFFWAPHAGASGSRLAAQLPIGLQFF